MAGRTVVSVSVSPGVLQWAEERVAVVHVGWVGDDAVDEEQGGWLWFQEALDLCSLNGIDVGSD
jgi:hypothetical protein